MTLSGRPLTAGDAVAAVSRALGAVRTDPGEVGPETPLAELALTSVDFVEIWMALEEMVGLELDPASLGEPLLVRDLAWIRPHPEGRPVRPSES